MRSLLASFFHRFLEWPMVQYLLFNIFQWFCTIKNHWFSDRFLLIFYVLSKPLPGTVFRGSLCRSLLKNWFRVPFSIFGISKKAPLGRHFHVKGQKMVSWNLRRLSWDDPWRPFLNIVIFCFVGRLLARFWCLWLPFGRFQFLFNILFASCWSILVDLAPLWRPKTDPAPNDFHKTFFIYLFQFFQMFDCFEWIPADSWIDLGIVFQPNLYHLSPFVFYLLTRQPHIYIYICL